MKTKLMIVAVSAALLFSSPANAVSDFQEEALKALGGLFIVEKVIDYSAHRNQSMYGNHSQYNSPQYRGDETDAELSIQRSYRDGVRAREREELNRARQRAYQCGRTGRC